MYGRKYFDLRDKKVIGNMILFFKCFACHCHVFFCLGESFNHIECGFNCDRTKISVKYDLIKS